jgi:hypothetical protein
MHSLTLFIPGLLTPSRDMAEQDIPRVPSLEKLLACASREQLIPFGFSDALCMLFKLERQADKDFPIAAITRLVDDEHSSAGIWMRADPVHLVADRKGLILMDESTFTLDQHDALVLAADIKDILAERGMILEAPTTNRWYVTMDEAPTVKTVPVHEVAGRDIHYYMPSGKDQQAWAQLLNEIQMILHNSPVNTDRERRGEKVVNSLWFWGCGELPILVKCPWSKVFTDEEIAKGFSMLANIPCAELPETIDDALELSEEEDDVLIVTSFGMRHSQYHDLKGWQDFITYLEEFWFADILDCIKSKEIKELTLLTEYQQFTISKPSLYQFWKRPKPVSVYVS